MHYVDADRTPIPLGTPAVLLSLPPGAPQHPPAPQLWSLCVACMCPPAPCHPGDAHFLMEM